MPEFSPQINGGAVNIQRLFFLKLPQKTLPYHTQTQYLNFVLTYIQGYKVI